MKYRNTKPYIVGIGGGTGSGKTTLSQTIYRALGSQFVSIIDADAYYYDLSHLPIENRHLVNFDHPDALDVPLLSEHISSLAHGHSIKKQRYCFTRHIRLPEYETIHPRSIILVEGIHVLSIERIYALCKITIYIDEQDDLRLIRRIHRDVKERGRSIDLIYRQYRNHVKPMHEAFVEPSKTKADIVIPNSKDCDEIISYLRERTSGVDAEKSSVKRAAGRP